MFKKLTAIALCKTSGFSPLPVEEAGGLLFLKIPPFMSNEAGSYELGIFDTNPQEPAYVFSGEYEISPYARHISLNLPPGLKQPALGLRLLDHESLETVVIEVIPSYYLEPLASSASRAAYKGSMNWELSKAAPSSANEPQHQGY